MAKTQKVEKSEATILAKKNAAEKRREKARVVASKFSGGNEPTINPLDYKLSIIQCFNWYNVSVDIKEIRGYLNSYLQNTDRKKLITIFNRVNDLDVKSIGILCRLKSRDQFLEPCHESLIEERISKVISESTPTAPIEVVTTKQEKPKELSDLHYEVFEGVIDEYVKHRKTDFDPIAYLKSKQISTSIAKELGQYYKTSVAELETAQTDLVEYGYGNWKKTQFKKFIEFVQSIVNACNQQSVSAKVRQPRKKKPVPPAKLVSKLKYMKEYGTLSIKSIKPESIIDSTELWVYNTKYRKLAVYIAEKGGKLSVKGCTILGYDIQESKQVMLRKPEDFFANTQLAKRALANGFKTIKTKPVTPNGRINEEMVLLGAF